MNILIVAATELELNVVSKLNFEEDEFIRQSNINISYLCSGVGIPAAMFSIATYITKNSPNFCINIGIAGSFNPDIKIGQLCSIENDIFGDLGAETSDGELLDLYDLDLLKLNDSPFENGILYNKNAAILPEILCVKASTVQKALGTTESIKRFLLKYPETDIETMESATIAYACIKNNIPFYCLRSISNKVEARNREAWNIELALQNLSNCMHRLIKKITEI